MAETWTARLIHAALKIQDRIAPNVPLEIRKAGAGRKGKLIVDGDDGGVFYLRWDGNELVEEEDDKETRNEFYMHSQTLYDLATGELDVRNAIAARLIKVTGSRSLYDSEDIMHLLEQLQKKITKVIGVGL